MTKILTLITALFLTIGAFAKDYTDTLVVSINEISTKQQATISLDQNEDGTYNFSLKNFILGAGSEGMAIGNINLDNVVGETKDGVLSLSVDRNIEIEEGDTPGDITWVGKLLGEIPVRMIAEQRGEKLYAVIDIDMTSSLNQVIKVVFSDGGYQIAGGDFENFCIYTNKKNTAEPLHWHSFASASGTLANSVSGTPHTFESSDVRPGSTGKKSVSVKSTSILGIVANGTITTGRMNAGSIIAADTENHAELDMSKTDKDDNGDPFYTELNGCPDSLVVWVKFSQGTANKKHPYATVSAIITDGTYYQDPEDKKYTNKLAEAKNAEIATTGGDWKRLAIPFNYIDHNVKGKAILVTISTNADAGKGSNGDEILIDDISLVYNAPKATAISVKGDAVEGFEAGKSVEISNKYTNLSPEDIVVTTDNYNAKVFKTLTEANGITTVIIKVASNDLNSVATYTLVMPGTTIPTGVKAIEVNDAETTNAPTEIYNVAGQRVSEMQPGQVYVVKKGGKTVKVLKK